MVAMVAYVFPQIKNIRNVKQMFYTYYHGCHGNIFVFTIFCEKWIIFKSCSILFIIFKARIKKKQECWKKCFKEFGYTFH